MLLFPILIKAQTLNAKVEIINESHKVVSTKEQNFENELELNQWISSLQKSEWQYGFLLAHCVLISNQNDSFRYQLNRRNAIKISRVKVDHLNKEWQAKLNRIFSSDIVPIEETSVSKKLFDVLALLENNGYPFAKVWLDSFKVSNGEIEAMLILDEGLYFQFESIEVDEEVKINPQFLARYLNIEKGMPFSFKKVDMIGKSISTLPYLNMRSVPYVSFSDEGKVRLVLDLENVQVSSFDGIVGIAPNSANNGTTLFTGQFDFKLRNPFARGTSFDLAFEKFQQSSQKLESRFEFPFIFSSPVGSELKFNLIRFDTSYVNLESKIGINYFFSGSSKMSFYFNQFRAYPLSQNISNLSIYKNITTSNYGVAYLRTDLDYMPNPLKGLDLYFDFKAGSKKEVNENQEITTTIFNLAHKVSIYLPLAPKATALVQNRSLLSIDSTFSQSQLNWIGGLKSVRGFNEGELPANGFLIQTVEVRYLTDKNSHAKLFYDLALINQFEGKKLVNNWYQGFGIGFNFKTGPGIFSLNYAVGKTESSGFSLTNGKVHFGFLSYF